jgi:hypothetical protein
VSYNPAHGRDARRLLPPFPILGISVDHGPSGQKIVQYELTIAGPDKWLPWHQNMEPAPMPPGLSHAESIRRIAEWNQYVMDNPMGSPAGPPIWSAEQMAKAAKPKPKAKRESKRLGPKWRYAK